MDNKQPESTTMAYDRDIHVLSYAIDDDKNFAMLEMVGSSSGINRIWAALLQGRSQTLINPFALYTWQQNETFSSPKGVKIHRIDKRIDMTWLDHVILVSDRFFDHGYDYLYWNVDEQDGQFLDMIRKIVTIPVLDHWGDYLWNMAVVEPDYMYHITKCLKCNIARFNYKPDWWVQIISEGLAKGIITLEKEEV